MRRSWTTGGAFVLAALCAVAMVGCANVQTSGIDRSGEHVFTSPAATCPKPGGERYLDDPMGRLPWDDVVVLLQPTEKVAPIGSEVVLVAGVGGADGYLHTNRRLEWSIAAGSVGHFVAVEQNGFVDLLLGDFTRPGKVTDTYAIGDTGRSNVRLNRGRCSPQDDVLVLRGQGWITLTSPVEGTSNVTVVAPDVYYWDARIKSAKVHWVDAQWQYPPPAINPAGTSHVFTTTVTRMCNRGPCEGWRVRYEIVDGPAAGFCPSGATSIEVPVDSAGHASAEIRQKQPAHGTNKISVQVIRPADAPGAGGQKLVVDTGTTMKTWTAADLAVHKTGPASAGVGATLSYQIEVNNPGDLPAKGVVLTDLPADGLTFLGGNPPPQNVGRQLQWQLGDLGARERRIIAVQFRAERPGVATNCCEVMAVGGLKASHSVATTIGAAAAAGSPPLVSQPPLEVRIQGPQQAKVGDDVRFDVTVTNRGQTTAANLRIEDRLDPGLEHKATGERGTIRHELRDLPPSQSQQLKVILRVTQPGRLCQIIEVTGPTVGAASAQACLTAVAGGSPSPGIPSPIAPPSGPVTPPVSVTISGPKQQAVGEQAPFAVDVTNNGSVPLRGLKLFYRWDPSFTPSLATDGYSVEQGALTWTIDELPAGRTTRREVHCKCQTALPRACSRATVVLSDGSRAEGEACLEIRPSPSMPAPTLSRKPVSPPTPGEGLTLSVVGLRNPVSAGRELTYEIRVANNGTAGSQQVKVEATVPEGMTPISSGTTGPKATKASIKQQSVQFEPVGELRPGDSLLYHVRVRTKHAGQFHFHVEATVPGIARPLIEEADTEVF